MVIKNSLPKIIFSPSALPGRWGSWSEWSVCGADCRQTRRRACTGDTPCSGAHAQHADCVGDYCGVHGGK